MKEMVAAGDMDYVTANGNYYIFAPVPERTYTYVTVIDIASADGQEFDVDYKSQAQAI